MADQTESRTRPGSSNLLTELEHSGLLSRGQVSRIEQSFSADTDEVGSLTSRLTAEGLLTDFQAGMIAEGRLHELTLGNYTLLDRLGAGGMGEVYRAVHRRMQRKVALKVLPSAAVADREAVERFHREVQAAARLNHPHIVTAYDADEANGTHFLVMELVDGDDLTRLVRDHGPLAAAQAVECIAQAARGLEYAHAQGVIHRDIKPSNLLLDAQGTVRVLDLGLARLDMEAEATGADTTPALTTTGAIMGTVDYMAPEQAEDTRRSDARSDIYSLGCTLYFLLTGKPPYSGDTLMQRLLAHREQPQPDLPDGVPPPLNDVFRRMTARDPAERYDSMTELHTALEECRTADPALSETSHDAGATQQELTRPDADAADASAPTVTIETLKQSSHLADTLRQPGGSASPPLRRKRLWLGLVPLLGAVLLAGLVLKLQTPAGTVVLEIDDPAALGAVVTIDEQKQITITRQGERSIKVVADGKRHTLQVTQGGFETFTREFSVGKGETKTIRVRLEQVVEQTAQHPESVPTEKSQPLSLLERNRRAVAAVRGDGGTVETWNGTEVVNNAYYLGEGKISRETLSLLTAVPGLERLIVRGMESGPFGEADLRQIGKLPLRSLDMSDCELTDESIRFLSPLQDVRWLMLGYIPGIRSRSCEVLSRLKWLRHLNLTGTAVGDAGLHQLASLQRLAFLGLGGCEISAAGVAELSRLPNLTRLSLRNCPLDDSSVEALGRLSGLCLLDLRQTGLTGAGLARLRELLPECAILHEKLPTDDREREAIRRVLEHGGTVKGYAGFQVLQYADQGAEPVAEVTLNNASAEVWQAVGRSRSARSVHCVNQQNLEDCLTAIEGLRSLQTLHVSSPVGPLTDEVLRPLTEFRHLEQLNLDGAKFPTADQWDLQSSFPMLSHLILSGCTIDDGGLRRFVRNAPHLIELYVNTCTGVTTESLADVAQLSQLRTLVASGTGLDDTAVPLLAGMRQLRLLNVSGTQLTAAGVARLREALPDCVVLWDDELYWTKTPPAAAAELAPSSATDTVP